MNLNRASIIGRLTRDPEAKALDSGQNLTTFSVATNQVWKDAATGEKKEKAEFHDIVAWRRLGDICGQYLHKGDLVFIEGKLQTRRWDDKNGNKKQRTEIIASDMIMLGSPSSKEDKKAARANEARPVEETVIVDSVAF